MQATAPTSVPRVEDTAGLNVRTHFLRFLRSYTDETGEKSYLKRVEGLLHPERNALYVDMRHVQAFSDSLSSSIELQYYRMYPFVCEALLMAAAELAKDEIQRQRLTKKELYVSFHSGPQYASVRELSAGRIGTMTCIHGQVVRTHPVHPELLRGSFICEECGSVTSNVLQQFRYTQPTQCSNSLCVNRTRFRLDVHESSFADFQKLRIQESASELPRGAIPRCLDVVVRGELVETCQPGDRVALTGTLIVIPDVSQLSTPGIRAEASNKNRGRGLDRDGPGGLTGLQALGVRDLNYRYAFLACNISPANSAFGKSSADEATMVATEDLDHLEIWKRMTSAEQRRLKEMGNEKDVESKLISSLFPNVYGNDDVKRGILLMLFGGVPKRSPSEGTTLRGDINVCLVGDPSTAKSQFLKTVEEFSPRAVYTSGKASSTAGLTAAVVKDEESFEWVIEAGALMLADNGVCCIDEFDKMDVKDQVAIHEAMEQQTISITKAGIKATLNARASILAAANPIGGRYDRSRPLKYNIQLSAPILSRFDLFFVLIDDGNETTDYAVALRILNNHRGITTAAQTAYSAADMRKYIAFARCFRPRIGERASACLVEEYKRLRMADSNNAATSSWRITVRQLESLIRLSEAFAKMHCVGEVTEEHVKRAAALLKNSVVRIDQPDVALDNDDWEKELADEAETIEGGGGDKENAPRDEPQIDGTGEKTTRLKITYEQYKAIADRLVVHVRGEEDRLGDEFEGVARSELVQWYLESLESEIDSEEELKKIETICDRVIRRLVTDDKILIQMDDSDDPKLIVHPNYEIDA